MCKDKQKPYRLLVVQVGWPALLGIPDINMLDLLSVWIANGQAKLEEQADERTDNTSPVQTKI